MNFPWLRKQQDRHGFVSSNPASVNITPVRCRIILIHWIGAGFVCRVGRSFALWMGRSGTVASVRPLKTENRKQGKTKEVAPVRPRRRLHPPSKKVLGTMHRKLKTENWKLNSTGSRILWNTRKKWQQQLINYTRLPDVPYISGFGPSFMGMIQRPLDSVQGPLLWIQRTETSLLRFQSKKIPVPSAFWAKLKTENRNRVFSFQFSVHRTGWP